MVVNSELARSRYQAWQQSRWRPPLVSSQASQKCNSMCYPDRNGDDRCSHVTEYRALA